MKSHKATLLQRGGRACGDFRQLHRYYRCKRFTEHTCGKSKDRKKFLLWTILVNLVSSALQWVISVLQPLYLGTRPLWVSPRTLEVDPLQAKVSSLILVKKTSNGLLAVGSWAYLLQYPSVCLSLFVCPPCIHSEMVCNRDFPSKNVFLKLKN